MDCSIKIFREVEQFFEPHRMMFKELKKENSSHYSVSAKEVGGGGGETLKKYKNALVVETVTYSRIFAFCGRFWNLNPAKREGSM